MGGCNSVINKLETAGAFIGSAAAAFTGNEGTAIALGGIGIGLATNGNKGCSKDTSALIKATNTIVATAIVKSLNNCNSNTNILQEISIRCNPIISNFTPSSNPSSNSGQNNTNSVNSGQDSTNSVNTGQNNTNSGQNNAISENTGQNDIKVYEENPACRSCFESVFNGMKTQHDLERKMWGGELSTKTKNHQKNIKVRLKIDEEYALLLKRIELCGITTCKACALTNITQANIIDQKSKCYNDLTNTTIFKTNLSQLINEQLLNNNDVLSGVAKAFSSNSGTVSELTTTVTNLISSQVNVNFLNSVAEEISKSQIIQVNSATSTTFNNMSQFSIFNVTLEQVEKNNIVEKAISNDIFQIIAQIANENNTLNDIGETVFKSTITLATAIDNSIGKVMLATLISLGIIVTLIIIFLFYKIIKKSIISNYSSSSQNSPNTQNSTQDSSQISPHPDHKKGYIYQDFKNSIFPSFSSNYLFSTTSNSNPNNQSFSLNESPKSNFANSLLIPSRSPSIFSDSEFNLITEQTNNNNHYTNLFF